MRDPEKFKSPESDVEKKKEEIKDFLESISFQLKKEGMPVERDCRIDIGTFKDIYSPEVLKNDQETVKEYRKEWYGKLAESGLVSGGEELEMLKTAIFYKNLSREFVTLRSSSYDDIKNGVDNIILERKTGNLVCALDEVEDISGKRYETKRDAVLERNIRRDGAILKYGLTFENEKDKMKLKFGELRNLPIFYLALSEDHVEKGIKSFIPSQEEKSDYEKKLFSYFIASLNSQIKALKLAPQPLNPKLKERLNSLEDSLKKIST